MAGTFASRRLSRKALVFVLAALVGAGLFVGLNSSASGAKVDFAAKAKAAGAPWTKYLGPTTPVTPPKKFNLAVVTCFSILHGCVSPGEGACHAAKALGWKCTIFDGKGDPTVQSKAIQQAITDHANAIITVAVDGRLVKTALAQAKKAKIPVISTSNGSAPGQQGFIFDTSPNLHKIGAYLADWVAYKSGEKGALVPYNDLEFQSNISMTEGLLAEMKTCKTCKVYPVQKFTASQVSNALGPNVVSFVRKHPDVKYVSVTYDPAASFIVPALAAGGLGGKVKVVSQLGDAQNIDFIRKGRVQDGDGAWDNEYEGWATVDQIIRLVTHKPLHVSPGPARYKYGEGIPYVLLTKDNAPKAGTDWHASVDYISKFKKLWGVK
jgi:ribose transport system substrate-binding protein